MASARRIYIVDDDQNVVDLMTTLLEARGHHIRSNTVGALAIPEIIDMRPHCILLDLVMAEIDGYGLAGELKKRRELVDTKFVMVSARDAAMWAERSRQHGFDGFISKPINIANFVAQVEAHFE